MLCFRSAASVLRCPQFSCIRSTYLVARLSTFRTEVTDPRLHSEQQIGRFYTVPQDVFDGLFQLAGFTAKQRKMLTNVGENSIMVRKPALEIIDFLKRTDFSKPVNRFVICE